MNNEKIELKIRAINNRFEIDSYGYEEVIGTDDHVYIIRQEPNSFFSIGDDISDIEKEKID